MPVTKNAPAPYAPTAATMVLIQRHRQKGLPSPITEDTLERAGIPASLTSRTLQALITLDLIDEQGRPTETFEGLRLAPEPEYKQRMEEWLRAAYADALQFVDPAEDDEVKIRDAFRSYSPVGQQPRMVTLFLGLFTAAGVRAEGKKSPTPLRPSIRSASSRPSFRAIFKNQPAPAAHNAHPSHQAIKTDGLPAPLSGLLAKLPPDGHPWSKADRDRFLVTFGHVLDFCFPVDSRYKAKQPEEAESDAE